MDTGSVVDAIKRGSGLVGVALLAYSAGYSRAFIRANGVNISRQAEIVSLGGIPTWAGMMAFAGMGFLLVFLVGAVFSRTD